MNNGKYAFINRRGKVLSEWYDYFEDFDKGLALVGKDGKYFYINEKGEFVKTGP